MKTSYSAADRIRALVHVVDVAITIGVSLALLSAVAGTARGASAPQPSPARDVSGYVLDEQTGEALPYAGVKLRGTRIGAFTNLDGHFVLVGVPAPACTLEVSFVGYEDERMIVPATDGDTARVVVQMVPTTFEQEGIVVYGDRYQMWKAAEHVGQMTLSARDISDLPALGEVDIFRSLQLLPGISAVGDGSAGLYVRGGTPAQNLVMLDGMTVYHVDHFFGIFSAFNADAIKDIQVFKGGFPARYGGRLSSVVELTGKTGDAKQARYSFGGNFLSAHAVAEVPRFGNGSWLISARRSYTDIVRSDLYNNLFNLATGDDGTSTTTPQIGRGRGGGRFAQQESVPDFYFYDVNSKMTFAPTTDDVLAFSFYAGKDNLSDITETGGLGFRFDSQSEIQLTGALRQEDVTDWGNLGASLKWSRQWGPRFYSNLLFAQSTYSSTQGNSRSFVSEDGSVVDTTSGFRGFSSFLSEESNHVRDVSLKMDNEWHIASRHRIGFGAWISQVGTDYRAAVNDTLVRVDRESTSVLASAYILSMGSVPLSLKRIQLESSQINFIPSDDLTSVTFLPSNSPGGAFFKTGMIFFFLSSGYSISTLLVKNRPYSRSTSLRMADMPFFLEAIISINRSPDKIPSLSGM